MEFQVQKDLVQIIKELFYSSTIAGLLDNQVGPYFPTTAGVR